MSVLYALAFLLLSCGIKEPVEFSHNAESTLYGYTSEAISGRFSLAKPGIHRYAFERAREVPPGNALELRYRREGLADDSHRIILNLGEGGAWVLPLDSSFMGDLPDAGIISYSVPIRVDALGEFSIELRLNEQGASGTLQEGSARLPPLFELRSLQFIPAWYGFYQDGDGVALTPFVYPVEDPNLQGVDRTRYMVDPPLEFRAFDSLWLTFLPRGQSITVLAGANGFRYSPYAAETQGFAIPPSALPRGPYPLSIGPSGGLEGFAVAGFALAPGEPIPIDPGLLLAYPPSAWRDSRYELFRWDAFPALLLFDTADYEVQDRLFKRLALFVEKAGYRGTLWTDQELAGFHGWNAHDYSAEDLARFFDEARRQAFPLNAEERELERILLENAILHLDSAGRIAPGVGALISLSQESPEYLRRLFIVHEGFHGLFFINPDFQQFSQSRWDALEIQAKRFITAYFDYMEYDVTDPSLVVNEFMAYCLQQSVSQAAAYFGTTLARRIHDNPLRREALLGMPPGDARTWPQLGRIFAQEAEAFSAYVSRRWGLAAGRVHRVEAFSP